ncbi:MAG: O-antigen ligase family protein [Pyrinomonadaceae bacterium]
MTLANKSIFFLICTIMIVATMLYGTVHQPTIALFYFVVALMMVLWAVDSFLSRELAVSRSLIQMPIYATAIYGFVQIVPFGTSPAIGGIQGIPRTISLAPFETEMTAFHYLAFGFLLSIVLSSLNSAKRIGKLVTVIAVFGFAFAFFAILQSFLSPGKIFGIYERFGAYPFGTFVSRHNFAAFMEMTIALPLGLLLSGSVSRDKKLLYVTAIALMGVALLLSGSRGGLVATLSAVFLIIILTTKARGAKKIAIRAVLSIGLVAAVAAGTMFVGGESSLTRIAETAASKDVTTNRTHIWAITLNVIKSNLPFGAGLGAFGQAYTPHDDFSGLERVEQAHNDYLQVIADMGLVGVAIGAWFLFLLFRTGKKNVRTRNTFRRGVAVGAAGGIFAILVHSIFDFVLHTTAISLLFVILIGLLVAAGREYDDDEHEEDDGRRHHRSKAVVKPFSNRRSRV